MDAFAVKMIFKLKAIFIYYFYVAFSLCPVPETLLVI